MIKDKLSVRIPLQVLCYWPHNTNLPLHPINITPRPPCLFTSHRDIITQPHLYYYYIINFTVHISSPCLQTIAHRIHYSFPLPQSIAFTFTISEPKRKILLFPEMRVTKKIFARESSHLKNYSNSTFLC